MNSKELTEIARCFDALGHKSRVNILFHLLACVESGCLFNEIKSLTGIPASTLSHHLSELERGGLIERIPKGRTTRFRPRVNDLRHLLDKMMSKCCQTEGEANQ